jgi:TolB-like protein
MGHYRLNLVGPFSLFDPNGCRISISSQKAMALMALVVVSPGGVRSRRKLEAMLWGTRGTAQAQNSLRRELSNLRKHLCHHDAGELLISETNRVALAIDKIDVDVFSLGLGPLDARTRYAGDFLEGIDLPDCEEFEDWLREERARVRDIIELVIPESSVPLATNTEVYGAPVSRVEEMLNASTLRLPPKPSLAVLPFTVPVDSTYHWVGTVVADEISVCLSAFPQLFIVSSNAARTLFEQGVGRPEIAQRLGVRYLLDGSVIRDGDLLRISVGLLDARTSEQFWAESFVGRSDGSFVLQQEIATRIAPQIWTKVDHAERQMGLRLAGPVSGDYERYWRANALSRSWEQEPIGEAITLATELVESDATCPWATSLAAYCNSIAWLLHYGPDRQAVLQRTIQNYQAAMRYGADNVEALGYCAGTLLNIGGDIEMADRIVARALNLLPAHQPALFWGGWVDVVIGNPDRAIERFELGLRINPVSGVLGQTYAGIGFAYLQQGKASEALKLLVEADRTTPSFPPTIVGLCVAAQLTGDQAIVKRCVPVLRNGGSTDLLSMLRRPQDQKIFVNALRQAIGSQVDG